jgi:hypothetical protein
VALTLGAACLLLALLCGVGTLAVRGGVVAPPTLSVRLGPLGVEAGADRGHECPPHCEGQAPYSGERTYTVWLIATDHVDGGRTHARLLFAQPLR